MIKSKLFYFVFFMFLFAAVQVQFGEQKAAPTGSVIPGEEIPVPIQVTFKNNSSHSIMVHVLSADIIISSYPLEAKNVLEIAVEYGHTVRLEYPTCPNRTDLKQMGALNELSRTVLIRDDRDTVFIEEKFSGQRVKGKGKLRIPDVLISEPQMGGCQDMKKQKSDINQPENKNKKPGVPGVGKIDEKVNRKVLQEQLKKERDKKKVKRTRKEDPTRPENKTEKDKKKKN
ncbi:MAG: hypothetical protein GTO45_38015 [Candidatus Aminicenantes bacterium]|nr:hypothetical protein [Candidatus Aminicenantes bacterium]NIM80501.1 hypothetical protein [Candidatus Aminicenantes bacterium]NIN23943.1 hypothetical protein [Candidatus Aminicenantes bacterium]NIN47657.1 hypothetical protein [Candidatus Aminicenantes bacterium]NIN90587.1 hypothetical protein [Candidatus Aminicenantes bacterium]